MADDRASLLEQGSANPRNDAERQNTQATMSDTRVWVAEQMACGRTLSTSEALLSAGCRQTTSASTKSGTVTASLWPLQRVAFTRSLRDPAPSRMEPLRGSAAVSSTATLGTLPCWTFSTSFSVFPFTRASPSASVPPTACEGGTMFDLILGLAVAAGLFVYLGVALLRPDRF